MSQILKMFGGAPAVHSEIPEELFAWPYVNQEIEDAVLDVVRRNAFSATDITERFEKEFARWIGRDYGICYCNGTLSLQAAMYAVGLGAGDELICPTKTYWASCLPAVSLGASIVFCNIQPDTLSMDPDDLERCLSPRTKAIMVVHYVGYPADMDRICAFAKKHGLKIIEDVSHAQGGHYKGRKVGTFGDVAAMSLMSQKSFSAGEMGILVTDDREIYERAMAYSHYERNRAGFVDETEYLKRYHYMPLGGMKGRVNQVGPAIGLVRLKDYDEKIREVQKAMNYFVDLLEGVPGLHPIRPKEEGSDMAGWYSAQIIYKSEELGGLSADRFMDAVYEETGYRGSVGGNAPLHTHPYFKDFDLFQLGKPTRIAFADRDVRELDEALKPSEEIVCVSIPGFRVYLPEYIEQYAMGYRKVAENYQQILDADGGATATKSVGKWGGGGRSYDSNDKKKNG